MNQEITISMIFCLQVSAAQVQGFFMFFKQSGRAAIENAFRLCNANNNTKPKAEKSEQ